MVVEELLLNIEASIMEVSNSNLRETIKEEGSFSSYNSLMKKNWSNIINLPLLYLKKSKEVRARCKWEPPPCGWFKLNFDEVARGNLGVTSIGCIINDDSSKWVAKKASPIPPTTNNMAGLEVLDYEWA